MAEDDDIDVFAPRAHWSEPTLRLWSSLRQGDGGASNHAEISRAIADGAKLNVANRFKISPLALAIRIDGDTVKMLLDAGAEVRGKRGPSEGLRYAERILDGGEMARFLKSYEAQARANREREALAKECPPGAPRRPGPRV